MGSTIVGHVTGTHDNNSTSNGMPLLTSAYQAYTASDVYVETTHRGYAASIYVDARYHGKAYADIEADRSQVSYVQQLGTWDGATFTPNSAATSTAWREVAIRGSADAQTGASQLTASFGNTIQPIWVSPSRSTMTIRIRQDGYVIREELYICSDGTTFEPASRVDREFTTIGGMKRETRVDPVSGQQVVLYDSMWSNNRKTWERDAQGVERSFEYDAKGRLWKVTTHGVSGQSNGLQYAQITTNTYDAADQVKEVELKGGANGTLISKTWYDLGGNVTKTEEPGGRQTGYTRGMVSGRWEATTTFPFSGGAQKTVRYYRDGRTHDISGSGVAGTTTLDYSIDGAGAETTTTTVDALNGDNQSVSRQSSVTTDWTARPKSTLGYSADTEALSRTTDFSYYAEGQLKSVVSSTGEPGRRFSYIPHLGWSAQASDLNANATIDYAGMDRIAVSESYFSKIGSTWWSIRAGGAYDEDDSANYQEIAATETQLNNYSGSELSRARTRNILGQVTTTTTTFDWSQKKLTTTVDYPETSNDASTTRLNGQVSATTTAQGLTYNLKYDEFGRETGGQDPRKGWSNREFVSGSNDVLRTQNEADAVANRWTATYEYDTSGRVKTVTDAAGKSARYAYNLRGQLEYQWGDSVTPVRYEYDGFGQKIKMHTYRDGSGWTGTSWPGTGTPDTTRWVYYDKTGLLKEKRDAGYDSDNSRKVSYTYHADGLPHVRTWARGVTTTYSYNSARELSGKDYSDSTQDVAFTYYNRRGQLVSAYDISGGHTLNYDGNGFLWAEQLSPYFNSRVVTWGHDAYGRRNAFGVYLQPDWSNNPQFLQTYQYDPAKGRLSSMESWSGGNGNGAWRTSSYDYAANSNEVEGLHQTTWTPHEVHRVLEDNRDAVASFTHTHGSMKPLVTSYGTRDALGRIPSSAHDNTAEPSDWFPLFRSFLSDEHVQHTQTYNDRSELTDQNAQAMIGGSWTSTFGGYNRTSHLEYDNAQNRELANVLGLSDNPSPTALNQPDTRFGATVVYDKDGNLTSDGTWSYVYDAENRLIQSSKTGINVTYAYDYLDRRIEMRSNYDTSNPYAVIAKRYVWDGWNIVADLWADYGGVVATTYVWGLDVTNTIGGAGGIGGLVVTYYNGRAFLPLQDGRGNIYGYLDTATGKNAAAWDFTPYGETLHERGGVSGVCGTWDFPFRFQSKMQDIAGHLLYFGLRYYHPGLGRFINRDPMGEAGGLNLYAYCGNDPVGHWDYLGMKDPVFVPPPDAQGGRWLVLDDGMRVYTGPGGGGHVGFEVGGNQNVVQERHNFLWASDGDGSSSFMGRAAIAAAGTISVLGRDDQGNYIVQASNAAAQAKLEKSLRDFRRRTGQSGLVGFIVAANSGLTRMQREVVMMQDSGEILSYAADGTAVPGTPQFTPKDYTEIFTKQLRGTYDHFRKLYWKTNETFGSRPDHWPEHLLVFRKAVTDFAPADLKKRTDLPYNEAAMGGPYALFRGERWTPADFGNFNYGVAAYGFRLNLMIGTGGAALNQILKSGSGDSDRSLEMIMGGYDYALDRGFEP